MTNKSKKTVQERVIGAMAKIMTNCRGIQDKVKCGGYGSGNDFDMETFVTDMDRMCEVKLQMWLEETKPNDE
ncbi:MAG: hypothetical protein GY841_17600 [FCB group bacterium]|nr:hypothetical protein [FCB group bacterium]